MDLIFCYIAAENVAKYTTDYKILQCISFSLNNVIITEIERIGYFVIKSIRTIVLGVLKK